MRALAIVAKNEFYRYFISPLAYVYLICFLLLNGSFAFYFGHFFERGQADLQSMFIFQPWIYLLFIPGIAMRLWSEEFRLKTILQIATLPISISSLIWGKFIASWLFCSLALLLTFPFWIIVNLLGSPDNSVIIAGYLGSWLIAGCMLAISQTMSALTKNQVIALVLSVLANLFFFLSGLEYVLGMFRGLTSPIIVDMIASFSFLTHFSTISKGLLELRDIIFFASVIILFNYASVLIISFRTAGTTRWLKSSRPGSYFLVLIFLLLAFGGINLLSNSQLRKFRFDFTAEHMFTLTDSTQKVISNLPSPVTARLYYSPVLGQRDPAARQMFDNVRLLLQQYISLANGNLKLHIYDPKPLSNEEDRAITAGLQPLPIIDSNINAYFGLTLSDEQNHQEVIPFFPLSRQNFIEQDLTEAFYRLGRNKPNLGIITSLPVSDEIIGNVVTPKWEIINQLEQFYNIYFLTEDSTFSNIDALIIAHPQGLSAALQEKIKNYSFNGGKILAFFDIAAESLQLVGPLTKPLQASDFGSLPEQWGFRFLDKGVIADLDNSSFIDATTDYQNNPEYTQDLIQFYLRDHNFASSSPITAGLHQILLTSASAFTPIKGAAITFEPIAIASPNSELLSAAAVYKHVHPADILRQFKADNRIKPVAAHITGTDNQKPFELIVVGDSDLLYDNFWTTHQTILERNYAIPVLDNANFVLNALDFLRRDHTLIGLRGKNYLSRPFEQVEKLRIAAARDFKIREKEIFDNLARAKTGMQEVIGKRTFENRQTFTPDELAAIAGIRKQIDHERQELFNIRNNLNHQIDVLKLKLKFFAIYFIPLLLLIIMLAPLLHRRHGKTATAWHLNRRIIYIGAVSLTLLAVGLVSVNLQNRLYGSEYEGKSVFPNLPQQINSIDRLTLQDRDHTLIFSKNPQGLWTLEGSPHYLVYQNRIRSFLSALLEAVYYEKKASGIEYLAAFGLLPTENRDSTAIRVSLDHGSNPLLEFDIGQYDLDLGRGSRGAYIRFPNSFQVWQIAADFIDLSLQKDSWTYSSLWNLQFGRIAGINQHTDVDTIAEITKNLLNIYFQTAIPFTPQTDSRLLSLNIIGQDDLNIIINFYHSEGKYLAVYDFVNISSSSLLQNFAAYAKGIAYEISNQDMEKLINAVNPQRTTEQSPQKTSSSGQH